MTTINDVNNTRILTLQLIVLYLCPFLCLHLTLPYICFLEELGRFWFCCCSEVEVGEGIWGCNPPYVLIFLLLSCQLNSQKNNKQPSFLNILDLSLLLLTVVFKVRLVNNSQSVDNEKKTLTFFHLYALLFHLYYQKPVWFEGRTWYDLKLIKKGLHGILGDLILFIIMTHICLCAQTEKMREQGYTYFSIRTVQS